MTRKTTLTVCLLLCPTVGFTVVSLGDGPQKRVDSSSFKPVASVEGVMNGQFVVFTAMMETISNPKAKQRIERIGGLSQALAELANVNQYNSDQQDFQDWARKLRDTSLEISEEAEKESMDEAKVRELAQTIKNTCAACHDKYQ